MMWSILLLVGVFWSVCDENGVDYCVAVGDVLFATALVDVVTFVLVVVLDVGWRVDGSGAVVGVWVVVVAVVVAIVVAVVVAVAVCLAKLMRVGYLVRGSIDVKLHELS